MNNGRIRTYFCDRNIWKEANRIKVMPPPPNLIVPLRVNHARVVGIPVLPFPIPSLPASQFEKGTPEVHGDRRPKLLLEGPALTPGKLPLFKTAGGFQESVDKAIF